MMQTLKLSKHWPLKAKLAKSKERMNDAMYSHFTIAIRIFEIMASKRVILMILMG